jgi:hypothetical protein
MASAKFWFKSVDRYARQRGGVLGNSITFDRRRTPVGAKNVSTEQSWNVSLFPLGREVWRLRIRWVVVLMSKRELNRLMSWRGSMAVG